MNNTIFDDVFRTMVEKIPQLAVPLINEVFQTSYPEDVEIIQLRNEHHQENGVTFLPTVSLGSAVFSGEDVVTVKDRADRALYCAKNELKARAAAAMPAGGSGEKD